MPFTLIVDLLDITELTTLYLNLLLLLLKNLKLGNLKSRLFVQTGIF